MAGSELAFSHRLVRGHFPVRVPISSSSSSLNNSQVAKLDLSSSLTGSLARLALLSSVLFILRFLRLVPVVAHQLTTQLHFFSLSQLHSRLESIPVVASPRVQLSLATQQAKILFWVFSFFLAPNKLAKTQTRTATQTRSSLRTNSKCCVSSYSF